MKTVLRIQMYMFWNSTKKIQDEITVQKPKISQKCLETLTQHENVSSVAVNALSRAYSIFLKFILRVFISRGHTLSWTKILGRKILSSYS